MHTGTPDAFFSLEFGTTVCVCSILVAVRRYLQLNRLRRAVEDKQMD